MPSKQQAPGKQSQDTSTSRMTDTYPCRFRAFLRICHASGLTANEAINKAGLEKGYRNKLRTGKPVPMRIYEELAIALECEPTSLYYAPEYPLIHDLATRAYAARVEELLDNEEIPKFDDVTGDPIDVVEYLWQLGDPVLSQLANQQQQRDAYLLLRDEAQRLIERPVHTGTRRNQLGRFEIADVWVEDIIADIKVRLALAKTAYATLSEEYEHDNLVHIGMIKKELPKRFEYYQECVQEDEKNDCFDFRMADDLIKQIDAHLDDHRVTRLPEHLRTEIRCKLDQAYKHTVSQDSINRVIDADFYCRKIIFPTHQQDNIFYECFSRSRALIRLQMKKKRTPDFLSWWSEWRTQNTEFLEQFCDAWTKEEKPDFDAIKQSTEDMVHALIAEVSKDELYPSIAEVDDTMEQRQKNAQSRDGRGK